MIGPEEAIAIEPILKTLNRPLRVYSYVCPASISAVHFGESRCATNAHVIIVEI